VTGRTLLFGVVIAWSARAAYAAPVPGLNLAWDSCLGSGTAAGDKTIACANVGQQQLVCSFVTADTIAGAYSADWALDLMVDQPTLPPWWGPLEERYSYQAVPSAVGGCERDIWGAPGGTTRSKLVAFQTAPNRLRLTGSQYLPSGTARSIEPGVENLSHRLTLNFGPHSAGDLGCLASACVVFSYLKIVGAGGQVVLEGPSLRHYVTWRGGQLSVPCPQATESKKSTWGSLKALYH
jgi:hypothetical protein